jgi:hypothetical protein
MIVTIPMVPRCGEVRVRATIALMDPDGLLVRRGDRNVDERFGALTTPGELSDVLDVLECSAGSTQFSKRVLRRAGQLSEGPIRSVVLGREFWESVETSGIQADATALRRLVEAAAWAVAGREEEGRFAIHKVRIGSARDAPQRVRASDGASAWRADVTKARAGWRLHYWHMKRAGPGECEGVELALVLQEGDPVRIPE